MVSFVGPKGSIEVSRSRISSESERQRVSYLVLVLGTTEYLVLVPGTAYSIGLRSSTME